MTKELKGRTADEAAELFHLDDLAKVMDLFSKQENGTYRLETKIYCIRLMEWSNRDWGDGEAPEYNNLSDLTGIKVATLFKWYQKRKDILQREEQLIGQIDDFSRLQFGTALLKISKNLANRNYDEEPLYAVSGAANVVLKAFRLLSDKSTSVEEKRDRVQIVMPQGEEIGYEEVE